MRFVLATLIVLGCGGSKPAPVPVAATPTTDTARDKCVAAIGKAAKTGRGDEKFSPEDQQLNAEVEATMADGCVATSWPEPVLQCLTSGTTREELRLCTEMLSEVQLQDFMDRVRVVTEKHDAAAKSEPAQ